MSKDPGYSDSRKDTLESRNRFLQERNETLINKIEYINQVNDGLHLLLKEQENKYETLIEFLKNKLKYIESIPDSGDEMVINKWDLIYILKQLDTIK